MDADMDAGAGAETDARLLETVDALAGRLLAYLPSPEVGAALELAWLLATSKDDRVRNAAEAIALAEPFVRPPAPASTQALDVLAAAYAEAGRFTKACDLASAAERKAREVGDTKLTREILARRVLYQAGKPCRAP